MSVFDRVRDVLSKALSLDEDEIFSNSSLYQDLGAESIDFLDITFRLEREFGIRIVDGELFPTAIFNNSPDCVKDGVITSVGLNKLKEFIPHGDFTKLSPTPKVSEIPVVFTVATLVKFVESKLALLAA